MRIAQRKTCPKCRSDMRGLFYDATGDCPDAWKWRRPHMDYTCGICGYRTTGPCDDDKKDMVGEDNDE